MAGGLTISTLNNDTGVLATQNGMTGIAKAWVKYRGDTATVQGSFNVSSITRQSGGVYFVNFTTSMPNTNYACVASSNNETSNVASTPVYQYSTNQVGVAHYEGTSGGGIATDASNISVAAFSL